MNVTSVRVAVCGSGNGGHAMAADLALAGHQVTLFDLLPFRGTLDAISSHGGITVVDVDKEREDFARLSHVTLDPGDALGRSNVVFVVAPSYGTEPMVRAIGPYLDEHHVLVFAPGGTGNTLAAVETLRRMGRPADFLIGEFSTLPYAARLERPGRVRILLRVRKLFFAAFPAARTAALASALQDLFPELEQCEDVLETSLNNGNPISHPAIALLNAVRIEREQGAFLFYRDGITEGAARINEGLDRERLGLCRALGYKEIPAVERLYLLGYCPKKDNLYEAYQASEVFAPIRAPKDIHDRYFDEDIAYGLVTLASLGRAYGVETRLMDAVISLASVYTGIDYWAKGRTVRHLGIEGMDTASLKDFLKHGRRQV